MSAFHVEEWVSVFKLARLRSTNNIVSVIPDSIIEQWLLNENQNTLKAKSLTDENSMKMKQKYSRKHSHVRRGDRKHWANCCCVFNDNHKETHNPLFFHLSVLSLVAAFESRTVGY